MIGQLSACLSIYVYYTTHQTCLPNLYKLLNKVVTAMLPEFCEANDVISENQMGTRRECQRAKQQKLLNKVLNDNQ